MQNYQYYLAVWKKYAVFAGRAQRAEYWHFYLFSTIIYILLVIATRLISKYVGILTVLYYLSILIPFIAVSVRRLHDTGRSGWWFFINFIPLVGPIIFFVFTVLDSQPGENKYGPNPKGVKAA